MKESRFIQLADKWTEAHEFDSTFGRAFDEYFEAIVAGGEGAIPLLLKHMESYPWLCVLALRSLGAEIHLEDDERGHLDIIKQKMQDWGKNRGY